MDIDPKETLRLAELESTLWAEAQVITDQRRERQVQTRPTLETTGYGVLQMVRGKKINYFRDKDGIVPYEILMVYQEQGM